MSIETQAGFWLRNVNDYREEGGKGNPLAAGFRELSALLRRLFADYSSFETSAAESVPTKIGINADDLENYHNLMETVDCLYQMAAVGLLRQEGNVSCLEVSKAALKKEFKTSVVFPFAMLEKYGFSFRYRKEGKEVAAYKFCGAFCLFYGNDPLLIPAMKTFADSLPDAAIKDGYYLPRRDLFAVADFTCALGDETAKQTDISPLRPCILRTVGGKRELWLTLVERLGEGLKLSAKVSVNPYVFPNWTVKFCRQKKTVLTFIIRADELGVKLPLPYETAKLVIQRRRELPRLFSESIGRFGCVGCGKCAGQANIEVFEGVSLCRLATTNFMSEDAKSIAGGIETQADVAAVCEIVKESLA